MDVVTEGAEGQAPSQPAAPGLRVLPLPPLGFNPETAAAEELQRLGLPPKPDAREQPKLYEAWRSLFGMPVRFVEARASLRLENLLVVPGVAPPVNVALLATSRVETSRNWSGASIAPNGGAMFVLVAGQWTLPAVSVPKGAVPGTMDYACSTWVGLDGQRHYLNSSLPQIGVMQVLAAATGVQQVLPFFQWWHVQSNGAFFDLNGLAVAPGEMVAGLVWVVSPTEVVAWLRNVSTGEVAGVGCTAPSETVDGQTVQLTVTGATAEWVLERPRRFDSTELYCFPFYEPTTFSGCWAGHAPQPGPAVDAQSIATPRLIRMFDRRSQPERTALISTPHRHGDTEVRLTHGGSS